MFDALEMAPPDPIIGVNEAFAVDPNPDKINLTVGVYKDESGNTPVLACVKEAERRILAEESSKGYPPLTGIKAFGEEVRGLLFGSDHALLAAGRVATSQTAGGTGALRICGDYLKLMHPDATIWLSTPTWNNHPAVFGAAGVPTANYAYIDAAGTGLAMDEMLGDLDKIPQGDVVLLHGCCHNPTGIDPSADQWRQIGKVLARRKILPVVDFAYQGFGDGLSEDATGLGELCQTCDELIICSSYSKNFGLYSERVGAITVVAGSSNAAQTVMSHIKTRARANYSFPPTHGATIVATILADTDLRAQWELELRQMRDRINAMRKVFVESLASKGVDKDFSFLMSQRGMFSFSGLSKDQVQQLRDKHSVYILGSGRINVAGMTPDNMDRLCDAIADIL